VPSASLTTHLRSRKAVHGLTREEMTTLTEYMTGRSGIHTLTDHEARLVLVEMTTNSTDELKRRITRHKEGK